MEIFDLTQYEDWRIRMVFSQSIEHLSEIFSEQ